MSTSDRCISLPHISDLSVSYMVYDFVASYMRVRFWK